MRTVQAIPITLDKPRTLLLDLKAMALAERALAKFWGEKRISLIKIFNANDLGISEVTHLLWAGLLHEEPTLTYDAAMVLIKEMDLDQMTSVVVGAIKEQVGTDEPAIDGSPAAGPPQPGTQSSGTGSPSGPALATTSA